MVQAGDVIMAYFVIGAVMWGGGALAFDDAGVMSIFVDSDDGDIAADGGAVDDLQEQQGIIQQTAALAVGGLVFVMNLLADIISFMNWPLVVFLQNNAPPTLTVLLGGSFTAGFYLSMLSLLK